MNRREELEKGCGLQESIGSPKCSKDSPCDECLTRLSERLMAEKEFKEWLELFYTHLIDLNFKDTAGFLRNKIAELGGQA